MKFNRYSLNIAVQQKSISIVWTYTCEIMIVSQPYFLIIKNKAIEMLNILHKNVVLNI